MDNSFEKTIKHLPTPHRFPLDTFCLASFTDCGLLELHLLVLSLTSPCEFRKPPYYRWISPFSDVRWAALLLFHYGTKSRTWTCDIIVNSNTLYPLSYFGEPSMNYEAAPWTPVPFEYSPSIATLLVLLSTYSPLGNLSFAFRPPKLVNLALALTALIPKNYQPSPVSKCWRHTFQYRPHSIVRTSWPCTVGWSRLYRFSGEH